MVDDGSSDSTPELLDRIAAADPRVRVIHLSRNFGHQAALTAGLEHARGDVVAMLDADLQDPPELIPEMVARWSQGAEVVYAVRKQRPGETAFKLATASWFYRLFNKLTQVDLEPNSGDFRLLDRRALDAVLTMTERSRFLRGMTVWVGFNQTAISYERDARHAGETKYTMRKMLRFSLDAIASFSHLPLQLATYAGMLSAGVAFIAIPVVIGLRIFDSYLPGFGSVTIAILLLGGIQLIALGVIGEYVGRIYDEVKHRPLYIVRDAVGVGPQGDVFVADQLSYVVQKFSPEGVFETEWGSYGGGHGQFGPIGGLAADAAGNVYVVDSSHNRIEKFDSSGDFIASWGHSGSAPGEFRFFSSQDPTKPPGGGIAVAGGYVYVADSGNNRIQRFNLEGGEAIAWGAGPGQFAYPRGLAANSSEVLVADDDNHR